MSAPAATPSPPLPLDRLEEPETIDDVLRNIDQIIDWAKEAQNAIGYFAVLYRRVTLAIRDAINEGTFVDGPRIERARRRLCQALLHRVERLLLPGRVPGSDASLEGRIRRRPGASSDHCAAHAGRTECTHRFDLGLALLTVAGDWPDSLRKDYDRVNVLLCRQIPGINKEVQRLSPELRWLRLLIPDEISEMQKALTKMREEAWLFAFYMAMHPRNATEKTVHQEAGTAALSSWYLQPSGRLSPFPKLVRAIAKHEKRQRCRETLMRWRTSRSARRRWRRLTSDLVATVGSRENFLRPCEFRPTSRRQESGDKVGQLGPIPVTEQVERI